MEFADFIAASRITGVWDESDFSSDAMDDGTYYEPFAFKAYEELTGDKTVQVGFIQPDDKPHFGMSPDRLIYSGDIVYGGCESKCPQPKKHATYIRQNKLPSEHRYQVLSLFLCSETIKYVDFISYCPDIPDYPLFVKRTMRSEVAEEIADCNGALVKFFNQVDLMESLLREGVGFKPSFTPPPPPRYGDVIFDDDESTETPETSEFIDSQTEFILFYSTQEYL